MLYVFISLSCKNNKGGGDKNKKQIKSISSLKVQSSTVSFQSEMKALRSFLFMFTTFISLKEKSKFTPSL